MQFYIDPGTGSMLFTILIGVLGAAFYALRGAVMKIRFALSGGAKEKASSKTLPYVIFSDDKRYWNVFGPICREFDKRGVPVVYMTASEDDPALTEQFDHVKCQFIGAGNKAFAKLNLLNADILLATTPGLDVYQWKRSKDVKFYAHILHMASDATLYRMFGLDYFDALLLSGEYQIAPTRKLEELRNLPAKELEVVGQPYMDGLLARLKEAGQEKEDRETTVLLAPSWGKSSILNRFGSKAINALLDTGYHVIVRPHPQSYSSEKDLLDRLMKEFPNSDRLEWNRDNDNFEVLRRSDIMISDFSGVMFDFALVFNKPVIYADTSFDTAPYDACWLEEETWTFSTLPKIGQQLTEENLPHIKEVIDACMHETRYADAIEAARNEAWAHIGESASRTVDYLMKKHAELEEQA